jgi:hypothetical protein
MHDSYLRIRFHDQRSPWLTLSVDGIGRAFQLGRLPVGTEALLMETETWVPLGQHPRVAPLVAALQRQPSAIPAGSPDPSRIGERVGDHGTSLLASGESDDRNANSASLWRRHLDAVQRWAAAL